MNLLRVGRKPAVPAARRKSLVARLSRYSGTSTLIILISKGSRWYRLNRAALLTGLIGIALGLISIPGSTLFLLVVGVVSLLLGLGSLVMMGVSDWRRVSEIYYEPRPSPLIAPYSASYGGWCDFTAQGGEAIYNPDVDARLRSEATIRLEVLDGTWTVPPSDEQLRNLLRLKLDSDETKVRMSSDLMPESTSVSIQKVPYSAYRVTNLLSEQEIYVRGGRSLLTAEQVVLRAGKIPPFRVSGCSNHIGVDVVAVMADGRIVLTKQNRRNTTSGDLWAPSGSGSMDWADAAEKHDLVGLVKTAMCRELGEEVGLQESRWPRPADFRILRYVRVTHWGGKPQFIGVARMRSFEPTVRGVENRYHHDHMKLPFDIDRGGAGVIEAITQFQSDNVGRISFPLQLCLHTLLEWLRDDPDAWDWFAFS